MWRLAPRWLRYGVAAAACATMLVAFASLLWRLRTESFVLAGSRLTTAIVVLVVLLAVATVPIARETASRVGLGGSLAAGGWLAAAVNVLVTTRLFRYLGSLERLRRLTAG